MGASTSKSSQQTNQLRSTEEELDDELHRGRCSIVNDSECGSFVFINREWSGSISSAEDALLTDDNDYNEPLENRPEGFPEDTVQAGASNEGTNTRSPSKEYSNLQQVMSLSFCDPLKIRELMS